MGSTPKIHITYHKTSKYVPPVLQEKYGAAFLFCHAFVTPHVVKRDIDSLICSRPYQSKIRKGIIMTKGTKTFRIIICVLLALTMLCSAFFAVLFCLYISKEVMQEEYGIYVAGVPVTRSNEDDVLGDGTVYYDSTNKILTLDNATIASADTVVYSLIDLHIQLIGENKVVCTNEEYCVGIFAGNYSLNKDLALVGDGSLTIEIPNACGEAAGLSAADLLIRTDVTVITPDCNNSVNGIICDSSLIIANKATVTVHNGASTKHSAAVRIRGNALLEEGTSLKVSTNPGASGTCKGLSVSGDLFLGKDTAIDVSIDDGATDLGECIRVSGLMEIGSGSTVTASAKNAPAIECFGSIEANKDAVISAVSEQNDADIFCSGAVVNRGAEMDGELDAIGGIHNRE